MPVNGNIAGTFINQALLKTVYRIAPQAKVMQKVGKRRISHPEGEIPVQEGKVAFLVEIIHLIHMNETIGAEDQCVRIDLQRPFQWEEGLKLIAHVVRYPEQERVLSVCNIGDDIRERSLYLHFMQFLLLQGKFRAVALIWDKPGTGNNLSDQVALVGSPPAAGEYNGLAI